MFDHQYDFCVARNEIKGDDLLYRFFNEVLLSEPDLHEKIPRLLVLSMSVWFPVNLYKEMPVLLPWVVRDPKCRGKRLKGSVIEADQWGAPNHEGFLMDDNSLVKGLPKSLEISSDKYQFLDRKYLGNEFVASHIWRINNSTMLAARVASLNTFIPNLVWLPSQVSKLSDREDSPVQNALKEISWSVYRSIPLQGAAEIVAERSWSLLPKPLNTFETFDKELNWFVANKKFINMRRSKLDIVIRALESLKLGIETPKQLRPSRYREGISLVSICCRESLLTELRLHQK